MTGDNTDPPQKYGPDYMTGLPTHFLPSPMNLDLDASRTVRFINQSDFTPVRVSDYYLDISSWPTDIGDPVVTCIYTIDFQNMCYPFAQYTHIRSISLRSCTNHVSLPQTCLLFFFLLRKHTSILAHESALL